MIKDLKYQIGDTEKSIQNTQEKVKDIQGKIAELLRMIYEYDQKSVIEILLEDNSLSDFFNELSGLEALNYQNQQLLENIKNLKTRLETEKKKIETEKESLERTVIISQLRQKETAGLKVQQEVL